MYTRQMQVRRYATKKQRSVIAVISRVIKPRRIFIAGGMEFAKAAHGANRGNSGVGQKRRLSQVILTFALIKRDLANYLSKGR